METESGIQGVEPIFPLFVNKPFECLIDRSKSLSLTTDQGCIDSFDMSKGSGDLKDIFMSFATCPNSFHKGVQFSV